MVGRSDAAHTDTCLVNIFEDPGNSMGRSDAAHVFQLDCVPKSIILQGKMRVLAGHSGWSGCRKRCRYPYLGIQQENHHQASGFVKMKEY
jgi:hypothetical protein